jgi:hypothetical protein
MGIKFKEIVNPPIQAPANDIDKQIEITTQVDRVDTFSIRQVQNEMDNIDIQIANLTQRKADLQAKIDSCVSALNIDLKATVDNKGVIS